jgi:UDP-GlcNAc:undecaprenyl-phosphate GlcNAc-1-phosphate transferase
MNPNSLALTMAFVTTVCLTPVVRHFALRLDFVDHPGERKIHFTPMPLLGGIAMYLAALLSIILFVDSEAWSQIVAILGGATFLLVTGVLDDRNLLHHQIKLMAAMPLAAITLIVGEVRFDFFELLLGSVAPPTLLLIADYLLTFVWVVGITAAFSILDHMDGLCAGVAAIASLFFLVFATLSNQVLVGPLAGAMLGAAVGFLIWNFKPARIFMGDGGAMFLGFMMAVLGIKLRFPDMSLTTSWMIPVLLLGVPIFDTTLITISRSRRGMLPFSSPGKDHTAHRLVSLGLGYRTAVLGMYAAGLLAGLLSLAVFALASWLAAVLGLAVLVVGAVGIALLERAPYERQQKKGPL